MMAVQAPLTLAVDIGATHIRGFMMPRPSYPRFTRLRTPSPQEVDTPFRAMIDDICARTAPLAVGVARAAGLDDTGRIDSWPSRSDWVGVDLIGLVERLTG